MKKIKLDFLNLEGAEMLDNNQLKKITGGAAEGIFCVDGPCSHVIQGSDGGYVTRNGTCARDWAGGTYACYCETGLGPVSVTSNGGISRCQG